jgi:small GTP-binding protein
MLGAAAVGKTSLVRRFVEGIFHEEYVTTIGVNIQKKEVALDDGEMTLLLWDLNGEDRFQSVSTSYLQGMAGYLLVADGTRPDTLGTALRLHERAQEAAGEVPFYLLVNKVDLKGTDDAEWGLSPEVLADRGVSDWPVLYTSAKEGKRVEEAFTGLAEAAVASS